MELWPPHTKAGDDTHQLLSRDWGGQILPWGQALPLEEIFICPQHVVTMMESLSKALTVWID